MFAQTDIWEMEKQFWLGNDLFYDAHLTKGALMIFPEPVGLLTREEIIRSITDAPRWAEINMSGSHRVNVHTEITVLTYKASAKCEGDRDMYRAEVISIYRKRGESWKLAFHQQIPIQV